MVTAILRAGAFAELVLVVDGYNCLYGKRPLFSALFMLTDLGMAGSLVDRRIGATVYYQAHTYLALALLVLAGYMLSAATACASLICAASIAFDRFMGFGLEYPVLSANPSELDGAKQSPQWRQIVTGKPAERFDSTARRYASLLFAWQTLANRLKEFIDLTWCHYMRAPTSTNGTSARHFSRRLYRAYHRGQTLAPHARRANGNPS